jgi:hypothetical protein
MFHVNALFARGKPVLCALGSALLITGVRSSCSAVFNSVAHATCRKTVQAGDQKDAGVEFAEYADCVAERRSEHARATALAAYGTNEKRRARQEVADWEEDICFRPGGEDMRLSFSTEVLAGGLAQRLIRKDYPDFPALITGYQPEPQVETAKVKGMNPGELFGRCVVRRNPAGVMALISSLPGSPAEGQATRALAADLSQCLAGGSKLEITKTFLRMLPEWPDIVWHSKSHPAAKSSRAASDRINDAKNGRGDMKLVFVRCAKHAARCLCPGGRAKIMMAGELPVPGK